jgi:hypothetical protein
VTKAGEPLERK